MCRPSTVVSWLVAAVPPKLSLMYDNVLLANASYHKDNGYETHIGENIYVAESEEVNVTCLAEGAKPQVNITWTINGEIIGNVTQLTTRNLQENRTFDSTSTLQFIPTGENVTVGCNISVGETSLEASTIATLLTWVKPIVFFMVNDIRVYSHEVYVPQKEIVSITCYAKGSKPLANLTWQQSLHFLESFSETIENIDNWTFDTNLTMIVLPVRDVERVVCRSLLVAINRSETVQLDINTYVLQGPSIIFNGTESDTIYFEQNKEVNLSCHTFESKPKPQSTWKINGKLAQDTFSKISQSSTSTGLIFLPKHNDLVECVSYLHGPNITRVDNVTFFAQNGKSVSSFDYVTKLVVPCGAIIFIVLFILCVYMVTRRVVGSTSFSTNADIPMKEQSTARQTGNRQKEYEEEASASYPKPPDLELPRVPSGAEKPYYSELPEQTNAYEVNLHTEEYYAAMGEGSASGKMFCDEDICFVITMKEGRLYNRWMGTINTNLEEEKHVVLSTVSDNVRKKDIHWHKLVKQILELPEATYLTKVEGIGIYEGKMYLIHEHMACQKLDVRMSDPVSQTEMMGYLLGILEGIEVIQSVGLLHPGLSTKKILVTKQGTCKLYDFCLSEDASNIVKIRKSKMICTLNQLPPEALLRDKYSKASDVWSLAVVVWEILSCGSHPFPHEEQSPDSEHAEFNLPEKWPSEYKLTRNQRLFDCWNQDTTLRPTTCQLKSSFLESFESLDTYGPSDTSTDDILASYVHMKGIEISKFNS